MIPPTITPNLPGFEIRSIKQSEERIYVSALSQATMTPCPLCAQVSQRIHSYYQRHPSDLPWGGSRLRLELTVRRFFCDNPACPRRTFAERLPQLLKPHAQKTRRLSQAMFEIAQEAGGEAGSRLGKQLAIFSSASTYLRIIRRVDLKPITAPRIIGIDDWAWRKRKTYGTIIVDLEKSEVIDLLPDREAETLKSWLKQYPTIEIITRDRFKAYQEAASLGAPQAIQVADRWHLLKNLLDTVKTVLEGHRSKLKILEPSPDEKLNSSVVSETDSTSGILLTPEPDAAPIVEPTLTPSGKRQIRYEMIMKLRNEGVSISEIVRRLGVSRSTVQRNLMAPDFDYQKPGGISSERQAQIKTRREQVLRSFQEGLSNEEISQKLGVSTRTIERDLAEQKLVREKPKAKVKEKKRRIHWTLILQQLWGEGSHDTQMLWEYLRKQGYPLNFQTVRSAVQRLQANLPIVKNRVRVIRRYSPHQAAWLFVSNREKLKPQNQEDLLELLYAFPEAIPLYTLVQSFRTMVKEQQEFLLDYWLDLATKSEFPEFHSFANGLRKDLAAVRAALSLKWSNGPVEGQVNRLKLTRRKMYGRGKLDLLKRRLIYSSKEGKSAYL